MLIFIGNNCSIPDSVQPSESFISSHWRSTFLGACQPLPALFYCFKLSLWVIFIIIILFEILLLMRMFPFHTQCLFFYKYRIQSQASPNISALVRLICLQFWAYFSILLICELGDRVINHFEDIDISYLCNWHMFPTNVRRILPMVLMNTQFAVTLAGYGNIPCSRDTCKRVIQFYSIYE